MVSIGLLAADEADARLPTKNTTVDYQKGKGKHLKEIHTRTAKMLLCSVQLI